MNALKKIIAEAKRMKKSRPNTKWTTLTKEASAKYRAGKLGAASKRSSKKIHTRKKIVHRSPKKGTVVHVKHILAGVSRDSHTLVYKGHVIHRERYILHNLPGHKKRLVKHRYIISDGRGHAISTPFSTLPAAKAWIRHLSK